MFLGAKPFSNPMLKTAAYTVPLGRFARVQPLAADLQIDGVNMFHEKTVTTNTASASTTGSTSVTNYMKIDAPGAVVESVTVTKGGITGSANYIANGYFGYGKDDLEVQEAVVTKSNTNGTSTVMGTRFIALSPHLVIRITASNISSGTASTGYTTMKYRSFDHASNEFWVKAGTVLDGLHYVVTEYVE